MEGSHNVAGLLRIRRGGMVWTIVPLVLLLARMLILAQWMNKLSISQASSS